MLRFAAAFGLGFAFTPCLACLAHANLIPGSPSGVQLGFGALAQE